MNETVQELKPTSWLAERLNLSTTTIERLRASKSPDIPAHIVIGKSIRYDVMVVEQWLQDRLKSISVTKTLEGNIHDKI
jgi:predicted DNA-binding transcriptional regulator AlpA